MPRKPELKKQTTTIIVNGTPITVILHPPSGRRTSWFAYWSGLVASKSTGQSKLEDAVRVAENMVRNGGKQPVLADAVPADVVLVDAVMSDEEFEAIQRAFFDRKKDPAAQERAKKTLVLCLEAIRAFKSITDLNRITRATADDCPAFQRKALTLSRNWRSVYPKSKEETRCLSANTVLKWSDSLQAAFERANRNAGKKCVRGVVGEQKLLAENPWKQFTWIEGKSRPLRQFDGQELLSLLDYLEKSWSAVTVAPLLAKVCVWSSCRRSEVVGLIWSSLRLIGEEVQFQVIGKWGVKKWFRIPQVLYEQLVRIRTDDPHVFAAYSGQLRRFYQRSPRPWLASLVGEKFKPTALGDWFYEILADWSKSLPKGHASIHVFRKTSLQHARSGEDINRQVAEDARVSEAVLLAHYVEEADEELRNKSNRTFRRILASLPKAVAERCGHADTAPPPDLERAMQAAIDAKDWPKVAEMASRLEAQKHPATR